MVRLLHGQLAALVHEALFTRMARLLRGVFWPATAAADPATARAMALHGDAAGPATLAAGDGAAESADTVDPERELAAAVDVCVCVAAVVVVVVVLWSFFFFFFLRTERQTLTVCLLVGHGVARYCMGAARPSPRRPCWRLAPRARRRRRATCFVPSRRHH